ncbi:hypothetical protein ACC794_38410, partial [Rhizobium ruizarguesonis]
NGQPNLLLEAVPMMFDFRNLILELIRTPLPRHPDKNDSPTYEIPGNIKQPAATRQTEATA